MNGEQIVAFVLFSFVAAVTLGPSDVMLTATGANVGVLRGLPCLFGVVLGMSLMMFLVALGLGQLILGDAEIVRAINWGGAALLLWLSWKIATAGAPQGEIEAAPIGFVGAAAFQWVNPKSWLVCSSAAATFLDADSGSAVLQSALFGVLFLLAAAPSTLVWLVFGAGVRHFLRSPRPYRVFNVAMGLLLAASVLLILN
ncbi:MAG: LysE family translocator [Alphaproteobacteria bacterium]|nr:LysE family translocator [Alphaproteobacteria bacterium]